ncbi:MAG: hypothetical protein JNM42_01990 [Propionivibrio sp.]|uniref:type IV pilus assembly protein FimV n=1 Tax=Propionivibrio sp. TaxID=2212460 RepID=UPI001A45CC75|nr:hypothetical protein [Propionivibrio sp.]MBL8413188.1 hypothetical protein [Propionivibrio sp.]
MDGIPWLTNAQIAVLSAPPRLVISTSRQVVDPVIQLAINSSCDPSLTRHYTALLSPPSERNTDLPITDRSPGDFQEQSARVRPAYPVREKQHVTRNKLGRTAQAGETSGDMARRLFPRSRLAQQRFIRQMVALNPEWLSSESGDETLPEGVELRYPPSTERQPTAARQENSAKQAALKRKPESGAGARDRLVLMPFDPPPEPPAAPATPGEFNKRLSDVELQINTMRTELIKLRAEYPTPSPAIQTALLEMESRLLMVELNAARITLQNLQAEKPAIVAASTPEVPVNTANSEKLAAQPPQPAPPAPVAVKPVPSSAKLLTVNTGLAVLLGLFALGLSVVLYQRTRRGRQALLSASTQVSPAAVAEQRVNPLPAKVTKSSAPPAHTEWRKEVETPMTRRVVEAPKTSSDEEKSVASSDEEKPAASSVVESAMEIEHAIELADIFLTYGRTQDALDVLRSFIQDNPKESLRPSLILLEIYKQADMRQEFEHMAEQLAQSFKVKRVQWDDTPSPANANPGKSAGPGRKPA